MASRRLFVYCTCRFEAAHRWAEAPDVYPFLRNYHRHEFHVKVTVEVSDADREVEFIGLKRRVKDFVTRNWGESRFDLSCEQMATILMSEFDAWSVEVSEDGENGAVVVEEVLP